MVESRGLFHSLRAKVSKQAEYIKSSKNHSQESRTLNQQPNCLFLQKLPFDIRFIIYRQIMFEAGGTLHIFLPQDAKERSKLHCQPCVACPMDQVDFSHCGDSWGQSHVRCAAAAGSRSGSCNTHISSLFSLVLSCHSICGELIKVIYSTFTFSLIDIRAAERFLSHTPAPQLNTIHSIHLTYTISIPLFQETEFRYYEYLRQSRKKQLRNYEAVKAEEAVWQTIWKNISSMDRIVDVQVKIYQCIFSSCEKPLLEPLTRVTGVENFLVELPWPKMPSRNSIEGAGFQIRRPSIETAYRIEDIAFAGLLSRSSMMNMYRSTFRRNHYGG
ncbi:hypothetical protein B0O99DRAFT_299936 [Bisporella sp. PMI_857]|nr:hypothetical protein B0O99DRAFT_299936 [Bisporella sp. PMI_857]